MEPSPFGDEYDDDDAVVVSDNSLNDAEDLAPLPPLFGGNTDRDNAEDAYAGDGYAARHVDFQWETVADAAFDEVVARVIMDPLNELDVLENVFIRREADGSTLLHVIVGWANCDELVERLLLRGMPPDVTDNSGWTPLLEAAQEGQIPICEVLLAHGATPDLALGELTPLRAAAEVGNEEMTQWLLQQPGTWSGDWDNAFFAFLLEKTPGAVSTYLDRFATVLNHSKRGLIGVRYSQLRALYGEPQVPVEDTALALVVRNPKAREILSHRVMKYLLRTKWKSFARAKFRREFSAYALLLVSYFVPTIWADPDWIQLESTFDVWVAVSRVIAWVCCVYLLVKVELNEFLGDSMRDYFLSFWNVLNLVTYVAILVSIPIEFQGFAMHDQRNSVLALIIVSLWVNLLQFLQVSTDTGLLIAMMSHMVKDVTRFLMLYAVFICGYSGAFYLLLRGQNGYESYTNSFITVFLMLFGAIDYSVFTDKTLKGWLWFMGNLLLLSHLVSVVIVLLNILIAMMATTYSDVWDAAEAEALQSHAAAILRMEKSLRKNERTAQYLALLERPSTKQPSTTEKKHHGRRKSAPSVDKLQGSHAGRSRAKRDITQGVLAKLKALPLAADAQRVVNSAITRGAAQVVAMVPPSVASVAKAKRSVIHPDATPFTPIDAANSQPTSARTARNESEDKAKTSSAGSQDGSITSARRPKLAGGFIEQLIEVPDLKLLEHTLFLKSAFDREEDTGAVGSELAMLEDGIRYELPIKKAKEDEQLGALHDLQTRVDMLTRAIADMQRADNEASSKSLRRQLTRYPTMGPNGLQYTTSFYKRPDISGGAPAVRAAVATVQ